MARKNKRSKTSCSPFREKGRVKFIKSKSKGGRE